mmetsp:Transcript_34563/g.55624  ORF Transcript_34563/g.55624 Transcript_34563/m.55624 type:complete len:155 (-) Transcript_34563:708-1172(-)
MDLYLCSRRKYSCASFIQINPDIVLLALPPEKRERIGKTNTTATTIPTGKQKLVGLSMCVALRLCDVWEIFVPYVALFVPVYIGHTRTHPGKLTKTEFDLELCLIILANLYSPAFPPSFVFASKGVLCEGEGGGGGGGGSYTNTYTQTHTHTPP